MTTGSSTPHQQRSYEGKHAPPSSEGRLSTLTLGVEVAIGASLLAIIGFAIFLRTFDTNSRDSGTDVITQGVACPHLAKADRFHKGGDEGAFAASVAAAADVAEKALDTSGQVFGRPEQAAIELRNVVEEEGGSSQVEPWLADSEESCSRLGRWPSETTG